MIHQGKTVAQIIADMEAAPGNTMWAKRVRYLNPCHFVELGTGDGASGIAIMTALRDGSRFTTVDCRNIYGKAFALWADDRRLKIVAGDTIDHSTPRQFDTDIDLLYIDTNHIAWHAATELRMWQAKMVDGALVIVDDLHQNDMVAFWEAISYDKQRCMMNQGIFRYDAGKPYTEHFARPENSELYSAW